MPCSRSGPGRSAHDRPPRRGAGALPRHRGWRAICSSALSAPSTSCASRRRRTARTTTEAPDPKLFKLAEEKALAQAVDEVERGAAAAVKKEDFEAAMTAIARLRKPVDAFFDHVTVNADDPAAPRKSAPPAQSHPRHHPRPSPTSPRSKARSSSCPLISASSPSASPMSRAPRPSMSGWALSGRRVRAKAAISFFKAGPVVLALFGREALDDDAQAGASGPAMAASRLRKM